MLVFLKDLLQLQLLIQCFDLFDTILTVSAIVLLQVEDFQEGNLIS